MASYPAPQISHITLEDKNSKTRPLQTPLHWTQNIQADPMQPSISTIVLTMGKPTQDLFNGVYYVNMTNSEGSAILKFSLVPKGKVKYCWCSGAML